MEAGPIIELSRKALGDEQIPEILTTIRQKSDREKAIVGEFRAGNAAKALTMKREDRTAELVPGGYREAIERAAQLVIERRAANADDPEYRLSVSAPTNMDAHRIGVAIRKKRQEIGQVGPDAVTIKATDRDGNQYDMALAAGDRVRLFVSTRVEGQGGSIGRNGSILTVLNANERGIDVRSASGKEGLVSWKTLADKQGNIRLGYGDSIKLAYGEVQTTHTAQGSTVDEHIYVLPAGTKAVTGFSAYSSGTRHERQSFMLISEGAERAEVSQRRPLNDTRLITEEDAWANATRNLSRQPTKAIAVDFLQRAAGVTRGAARSIQRGLHPSEMREHEGKPPMALQQIFQHSRDEAAVKEVVEQVDQALTRQNAVIARMEETCAKVKKAVEKGMEQIKPALLLAMQRTREIGSIHCWDLNIR